MDQKASSRQKIRQAVASPASDVLPAHDVASTPITRQHRQGRIPVLQTPATPQECATMVQAVEEAIQHAQDVTPDSSQAVARVPLLQEWLQASGVQLPTPAREDLHELTAAAEENKRLRKQIEAIREAELEMAAREAEETARGFAMLVGGSDLQEEDNLSLTADNERLQKQLAELQAAAQAAVAAAAPSPEDIPTTPASAHWIDGVQERATVALQRAADTRRLSGVFEEQQLASIQKLGRAEEQLSAVKAQRPGSSHSQRTAMQQRLQQAEQEVHAAAAAAEEASQQLQLVAAEKEKVQQELQAIRQQLEMLPMAKQHADLYSKLAEVQQQLQEEKQQHQRLTGSLLEHAGRLSHKYYNLSDDFGELQRRYHHVASDNEQLASQLKEAHEALFDLQAAVQATPPAKRQQQQQLMARVSDAEQAVMNLATEKSQLQQRLLQAQAFIACLQQRPGGSTRGQQQAQQQQPLLLMATPSDSAAAAPSGEPTPLAGHAAALISAAVPASAAAVAKAAPSTTAAAGTSPDEFGGFITPVKGRSNPLFDMPETPATDARAATAPAAIAHAANFALEPVSPILAAAAEALSSCAGQQQQQHIQWSAASHELQDVHNEQLGLRQEIMKARSALADIAGQLRGSIGGASAPAAAEAPAAARSTASSSSSAARSGGRAKSAGAAVQNVSAGTGLMRTAGSGASRSSGSSSTANQGSASAAVHSRGSKLVSIPITSVSTAAAARASSARSDAGAESSARLAASSVGTAARQSNMQLQAPISAAPTSAAATSAAAASVAGTKSIGSGGTAQRSRSNVGRKEFAFPCLDSGEQPQPLGPAAAAINAAPAADSPCESTSSIGSSSSQRKPEYAALAKAASEHYSEQQRATRTATNVSGASCATARGASSAAAAASEDAGGSRVQASSGSISISLDQFIADGESVSLEYGMSPGPAGGLQDTAGTAAAAAAGVYGSPLASARPQQLQLADAVAAAAALAQAFAAAAPAVPAMTQKSMSSGHLQQQQQQQQGSPVTPCMTAASSQEPDMCDSVTSSSIDWLLQQQQAAEQLTFERLAGCLAVTPGSAQSSAAGAGDAGAAARQWMLQQQQAALAARALYGTPEGLSAGVLQRSDAADMQSVIRPGLGNRAAGDAETAAAAAGTDFSPLQMQLAMTPIGAERVVSNIMLASGIAGSEESPQGGSVLQQQQQQRSLLTPSFATPTEIINKRAMAALGMPWSPATDDTATSAARQQEDDELSVPEPAAALDDPVQSTPAEGADLQAAQQCLLQTPHSTPASAAAAAAAAAADFSAASSSCTAAPWAAELAAQPADDSPVVPVATPAASVAASAALDGSEPSPLQLAASALLASITPAGLISPGELVPAAVVSYMTPDWLRDLKRRCAATTVDVAALRMELGLVTPEAAAASKASGLVSGKTSGQQQGLQQGLGTPAGSAAEGGMGLQQGLVTSQNQGGRWAAATPVVAAAAAAGGEGAAASTYAASAASARSNIDKLRRRAIAQSAAAAAAAACATPGGTEGAAAEAHNVSRGASPADLEATFAELAAAGAAADDSDLGRCDSGGSLAQYMGQQQEQTALQQALAGDVSSRSSSRSSSAQGYKAMPRPDCPTPGSAYSVAGDADEDGRGSASPDTGLLAGLSSSRLMARHLQQQLQRHLDRSASLPSLQPADQRQQPVHEGSAEGLAEDQGASEHSSNSSCSGGSVEGNAAAALAAAAAVAVVVAFPDVVNQPEVTPQKGPAQSCQQQQLVAAASPFTPGAMLNASAESRLLSPSTDLQHVFDEAQGGSTSLHTQDAAASFADEYAGDTAAAAAAAAVQALQDGRKAEEEANNSEAAPASAVVAQAAHSLRAHQLTSLTGDTFTTTPCNVRASSSISSPASDARGTLQPATSTATVTAAAPAASAERTALGAGHVGSEACSSSKEADPSLSSWAAAAADHSVAGPLAAASSSCGVSPAGLLAAGGTGDAASDGSLLGAATCSRSVDSRVQPEHIRLGDSPTNGKQTGATAAAGAAAGVGEVSSGSVQLSAKRDAAEVGRQPSAGAGSIADTPSSQGCSSMAMQGVRLGQSPEPCSGEASDTSSFMDSAAMQKAVPNSAVAASSATAVSAATMHAAQQQEQRPAESEVTAVMPSASAAGACSSMYATPAVAFESPGVSSAAAASAQQVYYTAMQHTARSTGAGPDASARRQAAATAGVVTFGGFDSAVKEECSAQAQGMPAGVAAAAAAAMKDAFPAMPNIAEAVEPAAAAAVQPEAHNSVLQQLLASPGGSSCGSPGAWEPTPAAAVAVAMQVDAGSCVSRSNDEEAQLAVAAAHHAAAAGADCGAELVAHPVSVTLTTAADSTLSGVKSIAQCREGGSCIGSSSSTGQAAGSSSSGTGASRRSSSAATAPSQQQQQGRMSQRPGSAPIANTSSSSRALASAAAAASHTPARSSRPSSSTASGYAASSTAAASQQQLLSPTLSDLGFIDAPTAADYARLEDEQQQQQQPAPAADGDLAGMTFEQRLALLCDDDSDGEQQRAGTDAGSCAGSATGDAEQATDAGQDEQQRAGADAGADAHLDAGRCAGSAAGDAEQATDAGPEGQQRAGVDAGSCAGSAAGDTEQAKDAGLDEQQELEEELVSPHGQLAAAADLDLGLDLPAGTGSVTPAATAVQEAQNATSSSSSSAQGSGEVAGGGEHEQQEVCRTPLLPAHLASRATQTSPALADAATQRACDAKDMSTQVTTPALQKQHSTASTSRAGIGPSKLGGRAAAAGEAAERAAKSVQQQGCQAGGGACDVSASPVKTKDQR